MKLSWFKKGFALPAALVWALQGGVAIACGYCIEDTVAAVYSHERVMAAIEKKHSVAFFSIKGPLVVNERTEAELLAVLASLEGIDKGSAAVSLSPAALTFSFDPAAQPIALLQQALTEKLVQRKLTLKPLRIIDKPASLETFAQ